MDNAGLPDHTRQTYSRIGGWLLLPTISLFISPFITTSEMIDAYNASSSLRIIDLLQIIFLTIVLVFNIIVLVFVVKRKRRAPALVISFYLFRILVQSAGIASAVYVGPITDQEYKEIILPTGRAIFWQLIWMWYFVRSKRVKGTFIDN